MLARTHSNFAFVDGNNLWRGMQNVGWPLDYRRFRIYLADKFRVGRAYLFLGFVPGNESLYHRLQLQGYICVLKETVPGPAGRVKGNCDVDLTLQVMVDIDQYEQAVVVTSDGDFLPLLRHIDARGKLAAIISPKHRNCSQLLTRAFPRKMLFLDGLRGKLEYRKEGE